MTELEQKDLMTADPSKNTLSEGELDSVEETETIITEDPSVTAPDNVEVNKKKPKRVLSAAKRIALIGVCAGLIEGAKLALAQIPNVEVVTLLCAAFGFAFGLNGVIATIIFVCIEPLIWGFGTWFISYLLYWPFIALLFMFLGKIKRLNRFVYMIIAVLLTVWFGVLTSLIDVGLFTGGLKNNFFERFSIYYVRGIYFYLAQIVTNIITFLFVFPILSEKLKKIYKMYLS